MYSGNINSTSILYHLLQLFFMVLNPILFASDFPQKFWPGRHNVFCKLKNNLFYESLLKIKTVSNIQSQKT